MTITEYIAALRLAIRVLPPDEIDQAVGYYDEHLHDAADPAVAMAALGTPKEVASSILSNYVGKTSSKPTFSVLWAVVLGVLAAPVAAPVAIGAFAVAFALLIGLVAVIFALLSSGAAIAIAGVGVLVTGMAAVWQDPSSGLTMAGSGLLMAGVGLIWTFGIIKLAQLGIAGLARLVAKLARKQS